MKMGDFPTVQGIRLKFYCKRHGFNPRSGGLRFHIPHGEAKKNFLIKINKIGENPTLQDLHGNLTESCVTSESVTCSAVSNYL